MIRYINGDILDNNYEIFCQQVNCQGVMGSGLAKNIRTYYPEVYEAYSNRKPKYLGTIDWIHTHDDRICVNMYAQEYYGYSAKYTDYIAFSLCLTELEDYLCSVPKTYKVAFPYCIGCGLGGGNWQVISALLTDFSTHIKQEVYIVNRNLS